MPEQPGNPRGRKTTTRLVPVKPLDPWEPCPWEPADATALQALVRGDCPPHLQQRAINFIVYKLCGTYDPAFRPGGQDAQRATDMALGKQFIGQQIVGLLKVRSKPEGEQA